jgi:threonine/homoserine/homoserine lactone efflux protein
MPDIGRLVTFALTAFVIIVIPGPSVMFIVARALADGRRAAALTVLGNTAGEYVQVVAVALGIGVLAERSVALFTVLKLLGAAYLIYLGVQAIRHRGSLRSVLEAKPAGRSGRRTFVEGFVVGVTNPKTVIFLAAILPEFVSRSRGDIQGQILLLGLVFSCVALICDTAWGMAAGQFRSWFARSPRRLELVGGIGGLAIIAVGVRLAVTGRKT